MKTGMGREGYSISIIIVLAMVSCVQSACDGPDLVQCLTAADPGSSTSATDPLTVEQLDKQCRVLRASIACYEAAGSSCEYEGLPTMRSVVDQICTADFRQELQSYQWCFEKTEVVGATGICYQQQQRNITGAREPGQICDITNAFVACMLTSIERLCNRDIAAWSWQLIHSMVMDSLQQFGCTLDPYTNVAASFITGKVLPTALVASLVATVMSKNVNIP